MLKLSTYTIQKIVHPEIGGSVFLIYGLIRYIDLELAQYATHCFETGLVCVRDRHLQLLPKLGPRKIGKMSGSKVSELLENNCI
jgi:hypothetical protein